MDFLVPYCIGVLTSESAKQAFDVAWTSVRPTVELYAGIAMRAAQEFARRTLHEPKSTQERPSAPSVQSTFSDDDAMPSPPSPLGLRQRNTRRK